MAGACFVSVHVVIHTQAILLFTKKCTQTKLNNMHKNTIDHVVIATDFSDNADRALLYAIELCSRLGADLSLFHVLTFDKLDKGEEAVTVIEDKMERLRKNYLYDNKKVRYRTTYIKIGKNKEEELLSIFKEAPVDLLLMGTSGAGKTARLLGSTASFMLHAAPAPVLLIPPHATFEPIRHITFACDYEQIQTLEELKPLAVFAKLLQADVRILHVHPQPANMPLGTAMKSLAVDSLFEEVEHELDFVRGSNPEAGIKQYLETTPTDCLAIKPRKHERGFWQKLLTQSVSDSLIGFLPIPVYAL
jgi:nucleotide-binding universal stress UspA family protein